MRRLDNKHNLIGESIVKTNGVPIDLDKEPVILFRGRDKLALSMLNFYRELCVKNGCTNFQLASMDDMIRRFKEFSEASDTMKQPGSTLGK